MGTQRETRGIVTLLWGAHRKKGSKGLGLCLLGTCLSLLFAASLLPAGAAAIACPNEALRSGPSALLPDCRAYEQVSPPDGDGRLMAPPSSTGFVPSWDEFPTELASPAGDSLTYMTYNSPLSAPGEATGFFDVYQALRSAQGWEATRHLTPSGTQSPTAYPGAISTEGGYEFVSPEGSPGGSLTQKGAASDYLSRPDGSFEFTATGSLASEPYGQGRYISEGGRHVIFSTGHDEAQSGWCQGAFSACKVLQLEPNAPPEGTGAVYDRSPEGPTHVVSLLPGDKTPAAGEGALYQGVSKDGGVVAFELGGVLYVRVNNAKTEEVAAGEATYAGLSEDGQFIYYVKEGDVHRLDTSTEGDIQINSSEDAELVNVSGDGSHAYFISKSQLDGSKGTAGEPNLYVWSGGPIEYITTVAPSDLEKTSGSGFKIPALTRWTSYAVAPQSTSKEGQKGPGADSSRTTPDGSILVFESRAKLTGYENAGHTEIYRYDDQGKNLECVSCNPRAEPATSDARLQEVQNLAEPPIAIHNLSDDGGRVFFETEESLVERDTDGINDVYEWHEEEGTASVDLISSGESTEYPTELGEPLELLHFPLPNVLFSVTPSGDDVVFLSQDALVPSAGVGGVPALYDARVNGGFPEPEPPRSCSEEECRPPVSSPPSLGGPLSESTVGEGNVRPRPRHHKRRCHRAKPKRHRRCADAPKGGARSSTSMGRTGGEAGGSFSSESIDAGSAAAAAGLGLPETASATTSSGGEFELGIEAAEAKASTSEAGMHPDFTTHLALSSFVNEKTKKPEANARAEDVAVLLPPGLVGDPNAFPRCSTGLFIAFGNCPVDSQLGIAKVLVGGFGEMTEPVYNLEVPHPGKEVARLGFIGDEYPVYIDVRVRTASDYGVTATVEDAPGLTPLLEAETTLWGDPPDPIHDEERLTAPESLFGCTTACKAPGGKRSSGLPPTAFMSNPSACQSGEVGFAVTSYQLPGQVFSKSAPLSPITNCSGLPFAPSFEATPTSHRAGAPTGLKTSLKLPQSTDPEVPATATMREARVTLPEGMGINPSAADGLAACSEEQVGFHQEVDAACPDASKLGTVKIISPDLPEPIEGALYQRTPEPGHQFRLWLVSDALGLHVKLPGEIKADPSTGQLTAVFSDLPQVPVEEIDFDVWGGPRAPLANPDTCGTYSTAYAFTPHSSDPAVSGQSQMTIDEACNQGFAPKLHAGVTNPVAGAFSPFVFDLTREEGEQALRGFELTLPEGELAKLKGVPLCPDSQAASGACPADSKIGSVTAAAGAGPDPLWLPQPGKSPTAINLAGPYQGAPFSIVTAVPAQAGPFDLGTVAVRSALDVDPESVRAVVEADPLPRFIEGVPVIYRRLHAVIDRPKFSLNPTDCRELSLAARIASTKGAVTEPAVRFQVDGCKALGFKPKLSLKLRGGTERGQFPALTATLKARPGDANVSRVSVNLPASEFLAQEHLGTICTRPRFAAHKCPKRAVYGRAKAWTPLLDKPLEGPVYLRANGGERELPDLVAALGGELEVDLVGYIDSHRRGIRTTFAAVPDARVSRFVLKMKGGAKGLLENSADLCRHRNRAAVAMRAQNGRALTARPVLVSPCRKRKR